MAAKTSAARRTSALAASLAAAVLAGCAIPGGGPGAALPALPVPAQWSQPETPAGPGGTAAAAPAAAPGPSAAAAVAASPAAGSAPATMPAPPEALARWWERFGDAQLTALIEDALTANAGLRSARAALEQARALRDVQAAGLLPGVDASGSAQRSRPAGGRADNRFQAGFDAGWELDIFGGRRAAVQAAEAEARAAAESLAAAQVSLAAEVALDYIDLRGLQSRLTIARRNLAAQEETLQLADWRVRAGLASSVELEQARAATRQTAAQVPALETSIGQSRHALAALTGRAPTALDAMLGEMRAPPQPSAALALSFPADTLRQRPDVRRAEEQITAALARVTQAEAARRPDFRLSGSLGLSALTFGGLSAGGALFHSLLAGVSVPLFDGGAASAQIRAQEAALEQARAGYETTVLGALQEVEDALVALAGDRERLARLGEAAEAAADAALLAQQRYASGLIDFQVVLDTQRTLLATQDSVAAGTASVGADHVRLYKALGGGWE